MSGTTLLLRQIHPSFVQDGYPTSQAFRPTPKDELKLSVYDGDQISVDHSFLHYTTTWNLVSAGVMAFSVDECNAEDLPVRPDPLPDCLEHTIVDFTGLTDKDRSKKSKKLRAKAAERGWLYQA